MGSWETRRPMPAARGLGNPELGLEEQGLTRELSSAAQIHPVLPPEW